MRIGFLISGALETLTGGYIYDCQLVNYLRRQGHQVEVVHFPGRNYAERLWQAPQLPLSSKLINLRMDVLLQDELDHPALIFLNHKLKSQARYPIVAIVHNLHSCELRPYWQNRLYHRLEKRYLERVDGFVFNSHTTQQVVESVLRVPRPNVIANPCGNRLPNRITESEIIERTGRTGPLRVVFLGNLSPLKGLQVLLAALTKLPGNSCLLTVIGDLSMDRAYVKAIRKQIRESRLSESVAILGPLNNDELAAKLKENQVLAVPSFYEGYGIAYLEGMGFGLPAIGTAAGAAWEIITHGKNGFLLPPGDSKTLAGYLGELNENRQKLMSMSLSARRRFETHPTWEDTGETILAFLKALLIRVH